jgi:pimeloyl-ACP methyl ester carboxylesterase
MGASAWSQSFERGGRPRIDYARPGIEFFQLLADPVLLGIGVPRGDGRPVLVLPGLGGGDMYLRTLRGWLRRVGYTPVRSGLRRNPGWSEELVQELAGIAEDAARRSGKPVTIVGHSMGGLLGRSVAVRRPEVVNRVITLAAPLAAASSPLPASVDLVSIYSKDDPIVRHPAALAREASARNIEVSSSHTGMAFHREVYRHLGQLLAAPPKVTTL